MTEKKSKYDLKRENSGRGEDIVTERGQKM